MFPVNNNNFNNVPRQPQTPRQGQAPGAQAINNAALNAIGQPRGERVRRNLFPALAPVPAPAPLQRPGPGPAPAA